MEGSIIQPMDFNISQEDKDLLLWEVSEFQNSREVSVELIYEMFWVIHTQILEIDDTILYLRLDIKEEKDLLRGFSILSKMYNLHDLKGVRSDAFTLVISHLLDSIRNAIRYKKANEVEVNLDDLDAFEI